MKNLAEEQQKMRERMNAYKPKHAKVERSVTAKPREKAEIQVLRQRIEVLKPENARLLLQIAELRKRPVAEPRHYEAAELERRHIFYEVQQRSPILSEFVVD